MAVQIQGVALDVEPVNVGYHFLDALNARVAKLEYMVAVEANQVVMLPIPVGRLELGLRVTKLVPDNQIAVQQHVEGVVDGCTADGTPLLFKADVQLIRVDMATGVVDCIQHYEAFRRLP